LLRHHPFLLSFHQPLIHCEASRVIFSLLALLAEHGRPDCKGSGSGSLLENTRVAAQLLHTDSARQNSNLCPSD
jgi:hypothetical protein